MSQPSETPPLSGPGELWKRRFIPRHIAGILGLSPARIYTLRKFASSKTSTERERSPTVNPFRRGEKDASLAAIGRVSAGYERLMQAQALAKSSTDPVLVVSCTGIVMGVNQALERLLFRSTPCLIGLHARELGVPEDLLPVEPSTAGKASIDDLDEQPRSMPAANFLTAKIATKGPFHPVCLTRGSWETDKQTITVVTHKGSDLARHHAPADLSQHAAEKHLQRVIDRTGNPDWTCVEIPAVYPKLGGTPAEVTIRFIDIDEDWRRFRLYWCNPPRLAASMSLSPTSTSSPSSSDHPSWQTAPNRLNELAEEIATMFLAESVTLLFLQRPEFRPANSEVGASSNRDHSTIPRRLVPLGRFGLPGELTRGEFFDVGPTHESHESEHHSGLVTMVLDDRRTRILDFDDPATQKLVREPNFSNFAMNSRKGTLRNGVMVAIAREVAGGHQVFGVVRLLNLFKPHWTKPNDVWLHEDIPPLSGDADSSDKRNKPNWVSELEGVATRLAMMHAEILRASQWNVVTAATENLATARDARDYLGMLVESQPWFSGFEAIVLWRAEGDDLHPEFYARCDKPAQTTIDRSYAGMATTGVGASEGIDIAQAIRTHGAREGELVWTTRRNDIVAIRIHNGFVMPVRKDRALYGCIAFYNSWAAEAAKGDLSYTDTRDICRMVAHLAGLKLERDESRRRLEDLQVQTDQSNVRVGRLIDEAISARQERDEIQRKIRELEQEIAEKSGSAE